MVVQQATAKTDTSEFANYKCTVGSTPSINVPCTIYKFSTELTELNFSSALTEVKEEANIPVTKDKLAIIKFTLSKETDASSIKKNATIKFEHYAANASTASTDKKIYSFTVKSQLFGDISTSTSGMFLKE